jgi:hypothetical protein
MGYLQAACHYNPTGDEAEVSEERTAEGNISSTSIINKFYNVKKTWRFMSARFPM